MSLKTLHAGARGTWIYQSPRITLLLIYAEAKGLDPRAALQRHLQNVERLGPHQTWILERLQWLGYRTERGGPPQPRRPEALPGGPGAEPPGGGPGNRLGAGGLPLEA
jgi:hypothetical protein